MQDTDTMRKTECSQKTVLDQAKTHTIEQPKEPTKEKNCGLSFFFKNKATTHSPIENESIGLAEMKGRFID